MMDSTLSRGETLIETLVTAFVLAVGVLGAASMQVTSLKNINISHSHILASSLVEDMSERLRANRDAALNNNYEHDPSSDAEPTLATNCETSTCTLSQLAAFDKYKWWQDLKMDLPSAKGQIDRLGSSNTFIVTIRWDENRTGKNGLNCPVLSNADMECYQHEITI